MLKYVLEPQFYEHFLKLSLATRILLDSEDCINKNELAKSLLCSFVEETQNLYNVSMLTCNFHYLLHINEDAKLYGSLDNISAFKFENHLQKIKKSVRKCNSVAVQLYNRQVEKSLNIIPVENKTNILYGRTVNGFITSLKLQDIYISIMAPDNFCMVKDKIIQVKKIISNGNCPKFEGEIVKNLHPYFDNPLNSSTFGILYSNGFETGDELCFSYLDINHKVLCLVTNDIFLFIPLIHKIL